MASKIVYFKPKELKVGEIYWSWQKLMILL
jgi:hypothetical protein